MKRHGGDDWLVNIPLGYELIAILVAYFAALVLYEKRRVGRLLSRKLVWKVPVYVHMIAWVSIVTLYHITLVGEFQEHLSLFIRRLGRFSYALVPFDLLLILRPNFINYLNLIGLHKWISRLILVLGLLHGIGFGIKWIVQGGFWEKTFRLLNFLGVVVFILFCALIVLSIRLYRKRWYNLFYLLHNFTIALFIGLIEFHARPGVTVITILNVALLLMQFVLRLNTNRITINAIKYYGNLTFIEFERPQNYPIAAPGSHLILRQAGLLNFIPPSHPYTIVNHNEYSHLIISSLTKFKFSEVSNYYVSYPFSSRINLEAYRDSEIVLIVGGSGISFALSILNAYRDFKGLKLVWSVRNKEDLGILENYNLHCKTELYVTSDGLLNDVEDVELQEMDEGFIRGRFDVASVGKCDLVITCGPESLVRDAAGWARRQGVPVIEELYNY